MLGEIGLIFNMFDAGIELDVALLVTAGSLPIVISLLGAALTMGAGMAVGMAYGFDFQVNFAIGATFVQTANTTCLPVLRSGGIVRTHIGQVILAATIIDDMIALIMLSVMDSFGSDEKIPIFQFFIPLLASVGWIVVLGVIAIVIAPRLIDNFILPRISRQADKNLVLFLMMSAVFAAYLPLLHYTRSSYLIGAFLCGATFSQVKSALNLYVEKGGQVNDWAMKMFFAANIGFQVPIKQFGTKNIWIFGLLLVFTAVVVKGAVGLCVPKYQDFDKGDLYNPHLRDRLVAGISMMSRGGFGFLISGFALRNGIFDAETYASVVLAVLIGTIFPAFLLNVVIVHFKKLELESKEDSRNKIDKAELEKIPLFVHIHLETKGAWGLMKMINDDLDDIGLKVKESKTRHGRGLNPVIISDLYLKDSTMEVFTESAVIKYTNQTNVSHDEANTELQDSLRMKLQELAENEYTKDNRCLEIQNLLKEKIEQFEPTEIEISQWDPYSVEGMLDSLLLTRIDGREPSIDFFSNLFEIIDINNDGNLDVEELRVGMEQANFDVEDEGFMILMSAFDVNGDGHLSLEEWNTTIAKYMKTKEEKFRYSIIPGKTTTNRASVLQNFSAQIISGAIEEEDKGVSTCIDPSDLEDFPFDSGIEHIKDA